MLYHCFASFKQSLLDFFKLVDSRLILMLLYEYTYTFVGPYIDRGPKWLVPLSAEHHCYCASSYGLQ